MNQVIFEIKDKFLRLFFPKRCPNCGEIIPLEHDYCKCYGDELNYTPPLCEHCGIIKDNCLCEQGAIKLAHFSAPLYYEALAKAKIHNFKFNGQKNEAEFLSEVMAIDFVKAFSNVNADVVTFVPMTKEGQKKRGFNQSQILAQKVALKLFLPAKELLKKASETKSQHTLNAEERMKNLKGVFVPTNEEFIKGKTIILCDDVKTTGTTLKKCEEALFLAGARDVFSICATVTNYSNE